MKNRQPNTNNNSNNHNNNNNNNTLMNSILKIYLNIQDMIMMDKQKIYTEVESYTENEQQRTCTIQLSVTTPKK